MNVEQMLGQAVANSSATAALTGGGTAGGMFSGLTAGNLFLMVIFSLIGFAYFRYGKTQQDFLSIICGVVLMVFSYFVTDTLYMGLTGIGIMALHYFLKRM